MSRVYRCARCDWQSEDPAAVDEHTTRHPRCLLCARSLKDDELRVDVICLGRVKRDLADILDLYALLPGLLGHLGSNAPQRDSRAARSDSTRLPGGDALVLLSGGSEGRSEDATTWGPEDPPAVAYELGRWEDTFREARREPAATVAGTVTSAHAYLMPRIGWAAGHFAAFDDLASDLRKMRAALVRATGTSDKPETGAPCFEEGCEGVHLEREWTNAGLSDVWSCPRCKRTYAWREYLFAIRAAMEREGVA